MNSTATTNQNVTATANMVNSSCGRVIVLSLFLRGPYMDDSDVN